MVSHVHDLIALAVGATRDGAELAGRRGLAAARRRAIKADMARKASDIDFGITSIARAHGLTPRYIQMLFEEDGTTFSEYLGRHGFRAGTSAARRSRQRSDENQRHRAGGRLRERILFQSRISPAVRRHSVGYSIPKRIIRRRV